MTQPAFQPVPAQFNFPQAEADVLRLWAEQDIYHRSLAQRADAKPFIFYEGPPTANGLPHPGHCLTRTVKDVFPRYKTMAGFRCERKAGWDTHGLPVEVEVCKELGIIDGGKAAIEAYGVEAFNRQCLDSVFRYTREWEELTQRLGFWVDLDQAYVTFHKEYVESVWWALAKLYERGLLYQGHKVVWWWAQGGTALSAGEVGEGYRDTDDPAITVKFKLTAESHDRLTKAKPGGEDLANRNCYFLAWTTTPWTLSSNCALAVKPDAFYYLMATDVNNPKSDVYIVERNRRSEYLPDLHNPKNPHSTGGSAICGSCQGSDLVGLTYEPLFNYGAPTPIIASQRSAAEAAPTAAESGALKLGPTVREGAAGHGGGSTRPHGYLITFTCYGTWLHGDARGSVDRKDPVVGPADADTLREAEDLVQLKHDPVTLDAAQRAAVAEAIAGVCAHRGWTLHACNVRTRHVHVVVTTDGPPERAMNDFKSYATRALRERGLGGTEERTWTRHGSTRYLNSEAALAAAIRYANEGQGEAITPFVHPDEIDTDRATARPSPPSLTVGPSSEETRSLTVGASSEQSGSRTAGTSGSTVHTVIAADFVTTDSGTGIVHVAPAFGEDDYRACVEHNIGFLCFVKPDGTFDERVTDVSPIDGTKLAGLFCKDADKHIIKLLEAKGALVKRDQIRHPYPFCPRAEKDPLIQYARRSWFIRTQPLKHEFLANNAQVRWQPEHIREGRFGNFLRENIDWALSRERFWGTPLPIWVCSQTGQMEAVASYDDLLKKEGVQGLDVWANAKKANPQLSEHLKVHKPYIDAVTYASPFAAGARMTRVPEVIDCWFDSGCMPFAQWGYPHVEGSAARLKGAFPADFISEAQDQTRGWFYSLLAISTMLFRNLDEQRKALAGEVDKDYRTLHATPAGGFETNYPHPFRNVICLGLLLGEDGLKLSKRKKNYKDPGYLFDKYGADALRWSLLAGQPPTASVRFTERSVEEALREFLIRWYNVYSFFVIYANLDGFAPERGGAFTARPQAELDRWVLSELHGTIGTVRAALDAYDPYGAANAISGFVDALSNWYVRRSRPRFWAHGWSADKADAYATLYECLRTLARLAAPFTPFFAETTWQNLKRAGDADSVHLADYPEVDQSRLDAELSDNMAVIREIVSSGLSARASQKIKVRQPLGLVELVVTGEAHRRAVEQHRELIADELNVKAVEFTTEPQKYVTYQVVPNFKVLGPKLGKQLPAVKAALAKADGAALHAQLLAGQITLPLPDGSSVALTADEVEVRLAAKPGFAAAQGKNAVVILATEITPALRGEGLARELVHHVQAARKDLDLPYDARIRVAVQTTHADLAAVVDQHNAYIRGEVLADALALGTLDGAAGRPISVEGEAATLFVQVV